MQDGLNRICKRELEMDAILITAIGSFSADIVIRNLKKANFRTVGCDIYPREWIANAKEVSRFYQVPRAEETSKYIDTVFQICQTEKIRYIFPLTDAEIDVWQGCRSRWENRDDIVVCISSYETIRICRDKYQMARFIEKNAMEIMPIPTRYLDEFQQEPESFPVICKLCDGRSSQGLWQINNAQEWRYFLKKEHSEKYIVQPFIDGCVITVDVVRNPATSEIIAVPRRELLRTLNGAGTSVCVFHDSDLEEKCKRLADALNIRGCVNFEFLQDVSGNYHFLECNPRFSGGAAFTCMAGFDCVTAHLNCYTGKCLGDFSLFNEMYIARKYQEYITSESTIQTELEQLTRQRLAEMVVDTASRNRVVLLYQDSPYALQEYIVQKMKQLFLQKGYQVTDISLSVADPYSNCAKQLGEQVEDVCLVFSMDAVGFEMQIYNGQRWINTMACPCVSYLYHYASCFSGQLNMDEFSWNIEFHAADRENLEFISERYQESADTKLVSGFAFMGEERQQWEDRIYDVYVPGDYIPSQICQQAIRELPEVFQMIAASMIAKMEQNTSLADYTALQQVLEEINFTCDNQEFFALLEELKIAEDFVRMKAAEQAVGIFLRHGLTVAVYGNGWEKYAGENTVNLKWIHTDQEKPVFEMHLNIMAHTKCFVDFCCSDSESTMIHILSAMKNGAVVLSNRQNLREEYFADGEGMLFYQAGNAGSLESLIENYFHAEDKMMDIARKAVLKSSDFLDIEDYVDLLLNMENVSD